MCWQPFVVAQLQISVNEKSSLDDDSDSDEDIESDEIYNLQYRCLILVAMLSSLTLEISIANSTGQYVFYEPSPPLNKIFK